MFRKFLFSAILVFSTLFQNHNPSQAMSNPTLSQKIGQMIMVGFYGKKPGDPEVKALRQEITKGHIGGVIFFNYNIESPQQVRTLTHAIQASAGRLPILLAADQEGGKVQRLPPNKGFHGFLAPRTVSQQNTPAQAQVYYKKMAQELLQAGFNLNFAPCVDLHSKQSPVIGGLLRSYSDDPKTIVQYAQAFIQAHRQYGILTCPKHYPGHGLARKDSHQGMVDITDTYQNKERAPFQKLIQSGQVDMIMPAHLVHRKADHRYPSSLSPQMLQNWLRHEDGFQGVVITDDLMMGAIAQHFDLEEVVIQAILAGNDILLFSNNAASNPIDSKATQDKTMTLPRRIIQIVERAIDQGKIPPSRIEESYQRIVQLKSTLHKKAA